jgi:hypothetical protein
MAAEQIGTGNPDGYYLTGLNSKAITITESEAGGDGLSITSVGTNAIYLAGSYTNGVNIGGTLVTGVTIGACTTGLALTGTHTTAISVSGDGTTGLSITSGFTGTTMVSLAGTAADGVLISGACTDGLHISGTNTANAIHVSGDQAVFALFDVDASADAGVSMSVDTTKTLTDGVLISGAGTVTTGINLSATAITTGIAISAGSLTDGIKISGTTPVDGIEISSACSGKAINLSGANAVGIAIATCTTGMTFAGVMDKGINFSGITPDFGSQEDACIAIGTYTSAITVADTGASFIPVQVNLKSTGNVTSAGSQVAAMRLRVDNATNAQGNTAIAVAQLRSDLAKDCYAYCGLSQSANISANITTEPGEFQVAFWQITGAGNIACTTGNVSVIEARMAGTGTGVDYVGLFSVNTVATIDSVIKANVGAGTVTNGVAIAGAMTNGINVSGAMTKGIALSGTTMTKGIDFASATLAGTDNDDAFISIGSWDDAYVVGTHTAHYVPIQVHLHSNTSIGKDIAAMRLRVDTSAANTLNYVSVQEIRSSVSHDCAAIGTFGAGLSIDDAIDIQTGEVVCGGFSIAGSGKITNLVGNKATVLQACNWNTSSDESVTHVAHFFQNGLNSTVQALLQLESIAGTATTGLNIPVSTGAMACAIKVGSLGATGATGSAFVVTLANSAAVRVYAETAVDLTTAACVRAGMFRMLVSGATEITSNAECFGVQGQLVAKQATLKHDNAGVLGTFEINTTHVHIDGTRATNSITSAVLGRIGGTVASCTVSATGILAGVAAMSNINTAITVTSGGILAGLYVGRYEDATRQVWDSGLYIDPTACTVPITLGNDADGVPVVIVVGNFADGAASGYGHGSIGMDTTDGLLFYADSSKAWQQIDITA